MSDNQKGKSTSGTGGTLEEATAHAWENARANGAGPGKYELTKIEIEAVNPIHAYIVTIKPVPKG
jgi:hypothetical protein